MPDSPLWLGLVARAASLGAMLRAAIHWGSEHTGLPMAVVTAIALVTSWRIFRHSGRFVIEVAVVTGLLWGATYLGWVRW